MKKFNLPLTTAISAAMLACAGCSSGKEWQTSSNTKVCVDSSGNRVPEDRWYYIARGGYIPAYYGPVSGGGYFPAGNSSGYTTAPASAPVGPLPAEVSAGSAKAMRAAKAEERANNAARHV